MVRVEVVPELVGRDLDRRVERHHSALPVVAGGRGAKAHVSDDWVPSRAWWGETKQEEEEAKHPLES